MTADYTAKESVVPERTVENPPPGVSSTFFRPCLDCGGTVEVQQGAEQPHQCATAETERERIAHAFWSGHDRAQVPMRSDLRDLVNAVRMGDYARPDSPQAVMHQAIGHVRSLVAATDRVEDLCSHALTRKGAYGYTALETYGDELAPSAATVSVQEVRDALTGAVRAHRFHDASQRIPGREFRHCEADETGHCQISDHYWWGGAVGNDEAAS